MKNQPSSTAPGGKAHAFTSKLNCLSRDIGAALLTRTGGMMLVTATVLGLGALPLSVHAGGWQVTKLADTADGTCDADCSLREAIGAANAVTGADFIFFASNVTGTITLDIATHGNLDITDELTITGPGADQLVINGGDVAPGAENGGILNVTSAATLSTVTGLTLTNGNSTDDGGAISTYADLSLGDVTIRDSHAGGDGGGIYVGDRGVTINKSTVSGNEAGHHGGGVFVHLYFGATINNSTVTGNEAGHHGGGVYLRFGDLRLTNSSVSGNTAGSDGGGFYMNFGYAILTNSTVSNNSASTDGGGFYARNNGASLTNSTVSGNTADSGGGFFLGDGDATLTNSIVSGNTGLSNPDLFLDSFYTLHASYSLIGIYDGTYTDNGGSIVGSTSAPVDALLAPLGDNGGPTWTHVLDANSPALDAGSNTLATDLDYDQRGPGYPRIVGGTVDMGAFERSDLIFADGFD